MAVARRLDGGCVGGLGDRGVLGLLVGSAVVVVVVVLAMTAILVVPLQLKYNKNLNFTT